MWLHGEVVLYQELLLCLRMQTQHCLKEQEVEGSGLLRI